LFDNDDEDDKADSGNNSDGEDEDGCGDNLTTTSLERQRGLSSDS